MAVYKGFEMVYTENSSAQAGACNANSGLTVAPVEAEARADDNPTRILQRRNSHLELAPFCVSGETVTVTSITQLLSQLLAATGKPRQAKRAALKRLLGRAK